MTEYEPFPTQHRVESELLKLLHFSGSLPTQRAYDALADRFGLSQNQRERSMRAGDRIENAWHNRCRFAKRRLVDHGFADNLRRGIWSLTPRGHDAAEFRGVEYGSISDYATHVLGLTEAPL